MSTAKSESGLAWKAERIYEQLRNNSFSPDELTPAGLSSSVEGLLSFLNDLRRQQIPLDTPGPDGPAADQPDADGDQELVIGRFRLKTLLGEGAHGLVYLADDRLLKRVVGLKLPKPHVLFCDRHRQRFLEEARAASQLQHPHIVQIYDAGSGGGVDFIASEYCSAGSLADYLEAADRPLTPQTAAAIVSALARAVDHAHKNGILHRDIKPSNILLTPCKPEGDRLLSFPFTVKLTDFGLAKALDNSRNLTLSGEMLGTIRYMAPEQINGTDPLTAETDVYGLGIVLYQLLAQKVPFDANSDAETLRKILDDLPPDLRSHQRLPRDLAAICMKCLEKQPSRRYRTAIELAEDLERYLAGRQTHARPLNTVGRFLRWCGKNRIVALCLAVVTLSWTLGLAGTLYHNRQLNIALRQVAAEKEHSEVARHLAEQQSALLKARQRELTADHYAADMRLALNAYHAQLPRVVEELLGHHAYRLHEENPRGIEWEWLRHWIQPERRTICTGFSNPHVALMPDKRSIVVTNGDQPAEIRRLADGRMMKQLPALPRSREVAVSADRIAVSYDSGVKTQSVAVFDLDGSRIETRGTFDTTIESLIYSPDGNSLLAGSRYGELRIWKPENYSAVWNSDSRNEAIAISSDGRLIAFSEYQASIDTYSLCIFDSESMQCIKRIPLERKDEVAAFSPDGKLLALSFKYQIRVFDTASFDQRDILYGARERSSSVRFSPDGSMLVVATNDGVLRSWHLAKGGNDGQTIVDSMFYSPSATVAHEGRILTLGFCDSNHVVTSGEDGCVAITHLSHPSVLVTTDTDKPGCVDFDARCVKNQMMLVAAMADGTDLVRLPDGTYRQTRSRLPENSRQGWVRRIDLSEDASLMASSAESRCVVTDLSSLTPVLDVNLNGGVIWDVAFLSERTIAVAQTNEPRIRVWHLNGWEEPSILLPESHHARVIKKNAEQLFIATSSDSEPAELLACDLQRHGHVKSAAIGADPTSLTISPDGLLIAVGRGDGKIEVLHRHSLKHRNTLDTQRKQSIWSCVFSNDGKTLAASGSFATIHLWQVASGRYLGHIYKRPGAAISHLWPTPDGGFLFALSTQQDAILRLRF